MVRTSDPVPAAALAPLDFRRPSRIGREAVALVGSMHDGFARRLATAWGATARTSVEVEHVATDQLTVDDYARALPVPTLLGQLQVGRLGATAMFEVDLSLGMLLLERCLGGPGDVREAPAVRRPTDLEAALLRSEVLGPAVRAVDEALRDLDGDPTQLVGVETTPQPHQFAGASELLLLLTYRVELRGDTRGQGLVSLGYPVTPLLAHLDRFLTGDRDEVPADVLAANTAALLATDVTLRVELGGTPLHAGQIAALAVGDVLRLDHRADTPARLRVADEVVGTAHLGRRGRRLAAQVATSRPADARRLADAVADLATDPVDGAAAPLEPFDLTTAPTA